MPNFHAPFHLLIKKWFNGSSMYSSCMYSCPHFFFFPQKEDNVDMNRTDLFLSDRAVQNVSGRSGVQTALSGIEAYKNITDAVNAAEEAAKKAKEAADKALNVGDLIK